MEKEQQSSIVTAAIDEVSNQPIALGAVLPTSGSTDTQEDTEETKEKSHA